jgi:hypothetical protein
MNERLDPEAPTDSPSLPAEPDDVVPPAEPPPPPPGRRWWQIRPRELAILIRGATILAIVGFSLAAFVIQLTRTFRIDGRANLRALLNRNDVIPATRTAMLIGLAGGAALGLVAALLLYLLRNPRGPSAGAARVLRTARLLSPLLLLSVVLPIFAAVDWDAFARISAVTFIALLGELCIRASAGELMGQRLASRA